MSSTSSFGNQKRPIEYYLEAATLNLRSTSRTAKEGTIDVSAGGSSELLCKENLDYYSKAEIEELKKNKKIASLDIDAIKLLSKSSMKDLVINNFQKAIEFCYKKTSDIESCTEAKGINDFITTIVKMVGQGLIIEKNWMRQHDSSKYPYTNFELLGEALKDFSTALAGKIKDMPSEPLQKIEWAKKTAAWVEYRFNLTDHFISDGCGKTSAVIATFIMMLANYELPIFLNEKSYSGEDSGEDVRPRQKRNKDIKDEDDLQLKKWTKHFCQKFVNIALLDQKQSFEHNVDNSLNKDKYVLSALDNLHCLSDSLTGNIGNTAYEGKKGKISTHSVQTMQAAIIATFAKIIGDMYDGLNGSVVNEYKKPSSISELNILVNNVATLLNTDIIVDVKIKNDAQSASNNALFRTGDSERYPYISSKDLNEHYSKFIESLFERIQSPYKYSKYETAAWIEYEVNIRGSYFADGNKRIGLALSSYFLMLSKTELPQFRSFASWQKARPDNDCKEGVIAKREISLDIYFHRWYMNYRSHFKAATGEIKEENHTQQNDPWNVYAEQVIYSNGTIFQHSYRDTLSLQMLKKATGLSVKELVVFKPDRMVIHEMLILALTRIQVDDNLLKQIILDENSAPAFIKNIKDQIKGLSVQFEEQRKQFEFYAEFLLANARAITKTDRQDKEVGQLIQKFEEKIKQRMNSGLYDPPLSEYRTVLKWLVADELLRKQNLNVILKIVKEGFDNGLKGNELRRLTLKDNNARRVYFIVGGPASGKSSLLRDMKLDTKDWCVINPDNYKRFLLTGDENHQLRASMTHEESSYIATKTVDRLSEMIVDEKGVANVPDIILDVVKSSDDLLRKMATHGPIVTLYVASCPVEMAVQRAFERARDEKSVDYGRYVPTEIILEGHKEESVLLPRVLFLNNQNTYICDTSKEGAFDSKIVAFMDTHSHNLIIYNWHSFLSFAKKSLIHGKARSVEDVYTKNIQEFNGEDYLNLILKYLSYSATHLVFVKPKTAASVESENYAEFSGSEFVIRDLNYFRTLFNNQKVFLEFLQALLTHLNISNTENTKNKYIEGVGISLSIFSDTKRIFTFISQDTKFSVDWDDEQYNVFPELFELAPRLKYIIEELYFLQKEYNFLNNPDNKDSVSYRSELHDMLENQLSQITRLHSRLKLMKNEAELSHENNLLLTYIQARSYHIRHMYRHAKEKYRQLCDSKDNYLSAKAYFFLGNMAYENDEHKLAKDFYLRASEKGDATACRQIATMYEYGSIGIEIDLQMAREYYHLATKFRRDSFGLANIGYMYANGKGGLLANTATATLHYNMIDDTNNHLLALGVCYQYGYFDNKWNFAPDYNKAMAFFKYLVDSKKVDDASYTLKIFAFANLGYLYEKGKIQVPSQNSSKPTSGYAIENYENSIRYAEDKKKDSSPVAHYRLGRMYYEGKGVNQNTVRAQEHFKKCFSQIIKIGKGARPFGGELTEVLISYYLGQMYHYGLGTDTNVSKAKFYYNKVNNSGIKSLAERSGCQLNLLKLSEEKEHIDSSHNEIHSISPVPSPSMRRAGNNSGAALPVSATVLTTTAARSGSPFYAANAGTAASSSSALAASAAAGGGNHPHRAAVASARPLPASAVPIFSPTKK